MDIGQALRFTTEDKKWVEKIAIAAVLIFTVIGWLAVVGWMLELLRRVVRGEAETLPPWTNLGKYFVDGLTVGVIGFIWMLPIIVLSTCLGGLTGVLSGVQGDNGGGGMVVFLNICLAFISAVQPARVLPDPANAGIYALQGTFQEAVNPGSPAPGKSQNLDGSSHRLAAAGIVGLLASLVGTILQPDRDLSVGAYASAVGAHLYGRHIVRHASPPSCLEGTFAWKPRCQRAPFREGSSRRLTRMTRCVSSA
jgi:hypothetical protein